MEGHAAVRRGTMARKARGSFFSPPPISPSSALLNTAAGFGLLNLGEAPVVWEEQLAEPALRGLGREAQYDARVGERLDTCPLSQNLDERIGSGRWWWARSCTVDLFIIRHISIDMDDQEIEVLKQC